MTRERGIDILVNNAGVCKLETFEDMDDELRDFHFDINIKGAWNVTKACLPYMKNRKPEVMLERAKLGKRCLENTLKIIAATKIGKATLRNHVLPFRVLLMHLDLHEFRQTLIL